MKRFLPSLFLLLSAMAFASGPEQQSSRQQAPAPSPSNQFSAGQNNAGVITPDSNGPGTRGCAYIHAFIFERRDGDAPRLVKETYCTPTGAFTVKRAFKPGIYPAVLKPEAQDSEQNRKNNQEPPRQ